MKPYCFILMPFGTKNDQSGREIDFDHVYTELIKPAIVDAGLTPIRADEEITAGIIHKPMFERLLLCDYAVADISGANANVFYELGVRHGIRPHTTLLIFAEGCRLPFDVGPLRGFPYGMDGSGSLTRADSDKAVITNRLNESREPTDDSPIFQLVVDMPRVDISRLKTDTFRDSIKNSEELKSKLHSARSTGVDAVKQVESNLGPIDDADSGVVVDLYLSYRAVEDWQAMVDLVENMSPPLASRSMIQEQLGFALNRLGSHKEAEKVLSDVIEQNGPSSETNGLLGRVYKDLWTNAKKDGKELIATGYLNKSVESYLNGFEADWRDAYPGINAATMMEMKEEIDPRQAYILPVIRYSLERRMSTKIVDYWDHATLLELGVLMRDKTLVADALTRALTNYREKWELKTTANNIALIIQARQSRNEDVEWLKEVTEALLSESK